MDSASKSHLGISAAPVPLLIRGAAFERLADSGGRSILGEVESAWQDRAKMLVSAKARGRLAQAASRWRAPLYPTPAPRGPPDGWDQVAWIQREPCGARLTHPRLPQKTRASFARGGLLGRVSPCNKVSVD